MQGHAVTQTRPAATGRIKHPLKRISGASSTRCSYFDSLTVCTSNQRLLPGWRKGHHACIDHRPVDQLKTHILYVESPKLPLGIQGIRQIFFPERHLDLHPHHLERMPLFQHAHPGSGRRCTLLPLAVRFAWLHDPLPQCSLSATRHLKIQISLCDKAAPTQLGLCCRPT